MLTGRSRESFVASVPNHLLKLPVRCVGDFRLLFPRKPPLYPWTELSISKASVVQDNNRRLIFGSHLVGQFSRSVHVTIHRVVCGPCLAMGRRRQQNLFIFQVQKAFFYSFTNRIENLFFLLRIWRRLAPMIPIWISGFRQFFLTTLAKTFHSSPSIGRAPIAARTDDL